MKLARGARLGPYEIVAPLGAGGMGEVYRARDTRLGRDVAIKVLPDHLSGHPEIRARFEREARAISALNHPNICTLFDVGHAEGAEYLVMELVDGEPLSDRLARGALPTPEVLRVGIQIADALERAHRAGVIHRDLKPGNIMVTRAGAKLMDFGLSRATGMAGATGSASSPAALTQSPTIAQPLTAEGTLLGTFQYMAPEQLEGREADARSDVWALGCVLYEMATGRRAFQGRSQASLIAAILEREPPAIDGSAGDAGPRMESPPQGLEWLIRHCLAKDPDDRIQTAHDVKLQLQRIAESAGITAGAPRSGISTAADAAAIGARVRSRGRWAGGWLAAAAMLVALAAFAIWAWPRLFPAPAVFRFHPNTSIAGATSVQWPRVSPDGRALMFQAAESTGVVRAWLLRLDEAAPQPIRGSEGLQRAYWSPDGREIAFVANGRIERLPVAGGTPVTVCPAPGGADLSWGAHGEILLDGLPKDSLRMVPAGGGELHPATRVSRADHEVGSAWPCFLPDGQHFLFIGIRNDGVASNIRLGRLGSLDSKLIGRSEGRVEYAPGGWVLFVRGGALVAQRLQVGAGRLTGEPITLADNIDLGSDAGDFSVSRNGVFAFEPLGAGGFSARVLDRHGAPVGPVLVQGELGNPCLSPDGRRLLYERRGPIAAPWGDVNVYDLERGTDSPVTFTGGLAVRATWSPDGRRFAYARITPAGRVTLMLAPTDGLGAVDSIPVPGAGMYPTQWIGTRLVGYSSASRPLYVDLQDPSRRMLPLLGADELMSKPRISPDGRWVVGGATGGSTVQAFVRNMSGPAGRWPVTSGEGGLNPYWSRNGAEIVFESFDGRVMAVDVHARDGFQAGAPHALFKLPVQSLSREIASWAPDARGERFAVLTRSSGGSSGEDIEVVTEIRALLSRR